MSLALQRIDHCSGCTPGLGSGPGWIVPRAFWSHYSGGETRGKGCVRHFHGDWILITTYNGTVVYIAHSLKALGLAELFSQKMSVIGFLHSQPWRKVIWVIGPGGDRHCGLLWLFSFSLLSCSTKDSGSEVFCYFCFRMIFQCRILASNKVFRELTVQERHALRFIHRVTDFLSFKSLCQGNLRWDEVGTKRLKNDCFPFLRCKISSWIAIT